MHKYLIPILIVLFSSIAWTPCADAGEKILFIGQQKNVMKDYVKKVEHTPDGFMVYTSIQRMDGLYKPGLDTTAGIHHAQYFIDKYPHCKIQLGVYMVDALDDVVAGKYDHNISKLAKWLKSHPNETFIRLGYEFDLPDNRYNPEKYKRAYRYIVDKLRAARVNNVQYVWHSAAFTEQSKDPLLWYPGDDYVDWVAASFFSSVQRRKIYPLFDQAQKLHKKTMIAEATPAGENSLRGKTMWFNILFSIIEKYDVDAVSYINSNWNELPQFKNHQWGDARIENHPEIKSLWLERMAQLGFID